MASAGLSLTPYYQTSPDISVNDGPAPWCNLSPRALSLNEQPIVDLQAALGGSFRQHNNIGSPSTDEHACSTPGSAINASDLALLSNTARAQEASPQNLEASLASCCSHSLATPARFKHHSPTTTRLTTANSVTTDTYSTAQSRVASPRHASPRQRSQTHTRSNHQLCKPQLSPSPPSSPSPDVQAGGMPLQGPGIVGHAATAKDRGAAEYASSSWQQHYPQRPIYNQHKAHAAHAQASPVDELLDRFHLTNQLPFALHMRTQRQINQLQQYQRLKESLQAAQAAMLGGMGTVQHDASPQPQETTASVSAAELKQQACRNAAKGTGSPSVARFNNQKILQDGMYVSSDTSFAASLPLRHAPTASLLFERHLATDEGLPHVQRFYLRPDPPSRPKSPPIIYSISTRHPPSGRRLPNGIPVCRLHSEQTALRKTKLESATRPASGRQSPNPHLVIPHNTQENKQGWDQALDGALGALGTHGEAGEPTKHLSPRDATASANVLTTLGAASSLGAATAEPVLDDPFAALVKNHFNEMADQQSQRLQRRLNASLPVILQSMGISSPQ